MILEEYDEELHMKTLYEEGKAAGLTEGEVRGRAAGVQALRQTLLQYINKKWQAPEPFIQKIQEESDLQTLQSWLETAWDARSAEELAEKIFNVEKTS